MKVPGDDRVWVYLLGSLMSDKGPRYVATDETNMIAMEHNGEGAEYLLKFNELVNIYFAHCREVYEQRAQGLNAPAVPSEIVALFVKAKASGKAKAE